MEQTTHRRIVLTYETYADNEAGVHELLEKTSPEHPYQFITGMGLTLDAFEQRVGTLDAGADFDFTLTVDESYGPYMQEHVIELGKDIFSPDGRFDSTNVYPGAILPLENSDGMRFQGLVREVRENTVVVDLNHPWADKALHFKGTILEARPATNEEITGMLNMMSGEGGCCGCGGDCHGEEGGCHGEGHGCHGEHHHGEGCCGHHGEHHHDGCCGGGHCH